MIFPDLIIFILYSLILTGLIAYNGFFGVFKDELVNKKIFALLFMGKIMAVPVFLFIYTKMYGGIENFDTGKFFHDVKVISDYGKSNPLFIIRLLFGFQEDNQGPDFINCLQYTLNWDNGTVKDYLYNDNRVLIRTHVLLNFIAFNSYTIHALLNCFLSFTGIFYLYKTFKDHFFSKEIWMLLILCFFPSLWFFTGALLKEGVTFFVLGCTLYLLKSVFSKNYSPVSLFGLVFFLYLSLLLKPYLLIFSAITFSLFFLVKRSEIKRKTYFFFLVMILIVLLMNTLSLILKDRSLLSAALKHQRIFMGVAKGGIFLADSSRFIRLSNDTSQIKRSGGEKKEFTIARNVSYMYWINGNQNDTLYCDKNQDTLTPYQLVYTINKSQSNIELPQNSPLSLIGSCFYYTLFYPDLLNSKNLMQLLAAVENLVLLVAFFLILFGLIKSKKEKFLPVVFIFFALSLCLLIGLTAPNSGAIFRYRSPAMVFLLLTALYFSEEITTFLPYTKPKREK